MVPATPLLGGKKVVFAYPRIDQATVMHFAHLMETDQFTPVIDASIHWIRSWTPTGMPKPGKR
jgi:hypothetical protein